MTTIKNAVVELKLSRLVLRLFSWSMVYVRLCNATFRGNWACN